MAVVISGTNGISGVSTVNLANGSVTQNILANGVAGTGPAFRAFVASQQNFSTNTDTKMAFGSEEYDTANCYDNSLYRFTPNVAGYYIVNILNTIVTTNGTIFITRIFKNGVFNTYISNMRYGANTSETGLSGSAMLYMNGSTDYIEAYVYCNGTSPYLYATGGAQFNVFSAALVRAA